MSKSDEQFYNDIYIKSRSLLEVPPDKFIESIKDKKKKFGILNCSDENQCKSRK